MFEYPVGDPKTEYRVPIAAGINYNSELKTLSVFLIFLLMMTTTFSVYVTTSWLNMKTCTHLKYSKEKWDI